MFRWAWELIVCRKFLAVCIEMIMINHHMCWTLPKLSDQTWGFVMKLLYTFFGSSSEWLKPNNFPFAHFYHVGGIGSHTPKTFCCLFLSDESVTMPKLNIMFEARSHSEISIFRRHVCNHVKKHTTMREGLAASKRNRSAHMDGSNKLKPIRRLHKWKQTWNPTNLVRRKFYFAFHGNFVCVEIQGWLDSF